MEATGGDSFAHDGARVRHPESWVPHPQFHTPSWWSPPPRTSALAPRLARTPQTEPGECAAAFRAAGDDADVLDRVQLARVRGPTEANRF